MASQWQVMAGGWANYDEDVSNLIQEAFESGEKDCTVKVVGDSSKRPMKFTIDLENMVQISPRGVAPKTRKIRAPYVKKA